MRSKLLFLFMLFLLKATAQNPTIEGDIMMCPYTDGTASITNTTVYDSYQWYYKYWFLSGDFQAIDGAESDTFTYDWYTYDQALLKVVVTLDGTTYESNTIQIDSYAWSGMFLMTDLNENVTFDPNTETYTLCNGGSFEVSVNSPYEIVTWYKDGVAIDGANNMYYSITEAGEYYAVAAPSFCPDSTSTSLPVMVTVVTCGGNPVEAPVIEGDVMLCPDSNGTASVTNATLYDTYQWYYKYWFTSDEFQAIDGADGATFTYDWDTYDQALLKIVTTLDGTTYESNSIQIDSYNWASLFLSYDLGENVTFDPDMEVFTLCEGTSFDISINNPPYNVIRWYKDGVMISEENDTMYSITEAGEYYAVAAPSFCPASMSFSPILNVVLVDCELSTDIPQNAFQIRTYPNPTQDNLHISIGNFDEPLNYVITDITGKTVKNGTLSQADTTIALGGFTFGIYFVKITNGLYTEVVKVIKN